MIEINEEDFGFRITWTGGLEVKDSIKFCPICEDMFLNTGYQYIIEKLKEVGLIDKDYTPRCCECYRLGRSGSFKLDDHFTADEIIKIMKHLKKSGRFDT